MADSQSKGLTCPNCASPVPVPEGARIVACPSCAQRSLVLGDRGIRRWTVARRVDRGRALDAVRGFFGGIQKALDLRARAEIGEVFPIYLPYWHMSAFVAGWRLGREKTSKDSTKPVEVEVLEEMHWNDAAADVSEFGVHRVPLSGLDLDPYEQDALQRQGMVFEPSESHTDAVAEATDHFMLRSRKKKSLTTVTFEKVHYLRPRLSIVYYPLWVARYHYRNRNYQVVVDGVQGKVLYGKAPGNILYRAAALVVGMALGNLALVHGLALTATLAVDDDDALGLLLIPVIVGIGLIVAGYRAFRYGEEVEKIDREAKKAAGTKRDGSGSMLTAGARFIEDWLERAR